ALMIPALAPAVVEAAHASSRHHDGAAGWYAFLAMMAISVAAYVSFEWSLRAAERKRAKRDENTARARRGENDAREDAARAGEGE
ncbi:MAG: hypothetical protein AAFR16_04285, partial [Pseudomonadota bacterium]